MGGIVQSLTLALKAKGNEGMPLPNPVQRLSSIGVQFARGQMSLIAAAPGGGKTSLAAYLVSRMNYDDAHGVPTLYFSADADRMTMAKGLLAGLLNITQAEAEPLLHREEPSVMGQFGQATEHIWWSFEPAPSLSDIHEEVEAYAYVMGDYPHMIVVDNLIDVADGGNDLQGLSDVQIALKDLARFTGAHVMVLAHVTGQYTDGNIPIPRSGLMWKPDKKAELILSLYRVSDGVVGIRVLKNRTGPAATDASFGIDLGFLPERGWWSE